MTDDQIKEMREKAQTAEAAFPGDWYSIGPSAVQLYFNGDGPDEGPDCYITPLVLNGHIREGDFDGDYELFCEYAVMVQPSVIRKLLHERDTLLGACEATLPYLESKALYHKVTGMVRTAIAETSKGEV